MTTERDLLQAWARGDTEAANRLLRIHGNQLRRFFASKTIDDVDDCVQSTLLACLEARERYRGDASFTAFMFGIARRKLFEHYRRKRRATSLEPLEESSVIDLGPSPSSILEHASSERKLLLALNELKLDAQIILEMYYWERMTAPEMGLVLGLKEPAVRSRLRRAKEQLRLRLDRSFRAGEPSQRSLEEWAESIRSVFQTLADRTERM